METAGLIPATLYIQNIRTTNILQCFHDMSENTGSQRHTSTIKSKIVQ